MRGSLAARTLICFVAAHAAGIFECCCQHQQENATALFASALSTSDYHPASGRTCMILETQLSSLLIGPNSASELHAPKSQLRGMLQNATTAATASAPPTPMHTYPPREAAATQSTEQIDQLKRDSDAIFSNFDVDGSGTISTEEFSVYLLRIGYSAPYVNELFEEMNINGDDVISPNEFHTLYAAVPSLRNLPGMDKRTLNKTKKASSSMLIS